MGEKKAGPANWLAHDEGAALRSALQISEPVSPSSVHLHHKRADGLRSIPQKLQFDYNFWGRRRT